MKQQNKVNKARRNTLLGTAAGATGLVAWQKPVIKSVLLPAHAGMSVGMGDDPVEEELIFTLTAPFDSVFPSADPVSELLQYAPETGSIQIQQTDNIVKSIPARIFDFVVPEAQAGIESSSENGVSFYLAEQADSTFKFQMYFSGVEEGCLIDALFQADGLEVAGGAESALALFCFGTGLGGPGVSLLSIAADLSSAMIDFEGTEIELFLDPDGEEFSIQPCGCFEDLQNGNNGNGNNGNNGNNGGGPF